MTLTLPPERIAIITGLIALFSVAALVLWETERRRRALLRTGTRQPGQAGRPAGGRRRPRSSLLHRLGSAAAQTAMIGRKGVEETEQALMLAGFRGRAALNKLMGLRVLGLFAGMLGPVLWAHTTHPMSGAPLLLVTLIGLLLGWRSPMIVLDYMGKRRRARLDRELPNAIDLLVVCGEAGLSVEASVDRLVREIASASPDIAAEFATVSAELRILPERSMAFANLHERIRTDGARALATTLSQASRYGTPLGTALRVLSGEMRSAYQLRMEERAARLPVLITLPMVLCILPCVFIVAGGPSFIDLAKVLGSM
ncbi:type II secretion system F family protein [Azospirillum sp.]|uniref:type II secretion system F family protein n=1 Tax=Azospirillum sp. TaxID=34012 RepID=UPI003D75DCF9